MKTLPTYTTIRTFAALFTVVLIAGCASSLEVYKIKADGSDDNTAGIRYYLPQPFIMATPKTDGSVDFEIVYLPDRMNTYAIQTKSIMGSYTTDITLSEEGFLKIINFNSDNTGVAKQLLDSAALIKAKEIEVKGAAEKEALATKKTEETGEKARLKAAEDALKLANLNLEIARRKLALLEDFKEDPDAPNDIITRILDANAAVVDAEVRLGDAQAALDAVVDDISAANAPVQVQSDKALEAPGPLFYRVDMLDDSVNLVVDFAQQDRQTWRKPKDDTSSPELPDFKLEYRYGYSRVVRPEGDIRALRFKLDSNRTINNITEARLVQGDTVLAAAPTFTTHLSGKTITVDLPSDLSAGEYSVEANFHIANDKEPKLQEFLIRVEK